MEEILILILQCIFELLFDILLNWPFDWLSPNNTPSFLDDRSYRRLNYGLHFLAGCAVGWLSIILVHETLITLPALRLANLLVSPFASGFFYRWLAEYRGEQAEIQSLHFWQAFWLTLALSGVRFAYAVRL